PCLDGCHAWDAPPCQYRNQRRGCFRGVCRREYKRKLHRRRGCTASASVLPEGQTNGGADTGSRIDADSSAVGAHDLLHEAHADAAAVALGGEEGHEDAVEVFGCDAAAVVLYDYGDHAPFLQTGAQADLRLWLCLHCV